MFNVQREHLKKILTNTEVSILFGINIQDYKVNFICQHEDICMTIYSSDILSSIEYFHSLYELPSPLHGFNTLLVILSNGLSNVVNFMLFEKYLQINIGNMEMTLKRYEDKSFYDQLIYYEIPDWNNNDYFEIPSLTLRNTLDICRNIHEHTKITLMSNKLILFCKNDNIKFKHTIDINYNTHSKKINYFNTNKLYNFINNKEVTLKISFHNNLFRARYDKYEIFMAPLMLM